jgi:hypothetical protein
MNNSATTLFGSEQVELPNSTRTRSGVEFDPSTDLWKYRDGVKSICLDFTNVPVSPGLRHSLKRVLTWYAEHYSPDHLKNIFGQFRHFAAAVTLRN